MPLETFEKQPGETRAFDVTFGEYLDANQDSARLVDPVEQGTAPAGINLLDVVWVPETRRLKFWVSGGTHGTKYPLRAWLNTAGGERLEADIVVFVKES